MNTEGDMTTYRTVFTALQAPGQRSALVPKPTQPLTGIKL